MRALRGCVVTWIAAAVGSQEPPRVEEITLADQGGAVSVEMTDGPRHVRLQVRADTVRLQEHGSRVWRVLDVASAEEKAILAALNAWAAATFEAAEAERLLAGETPPPPEAGEEGHEAGAPERVALLRELRAYEQVTRPTITKVFAGRATVVSSMQVQLGSRPARQLLWRRLGDGAFARPCFDTSLEPVGLETREERLLLLAIARWLAARLGGNDRLWQPEPADLANDVRVVLQTYRGYLTATSPRLQRVSLATESGSKVFHLVDEQNRPLRIRFDHTSGAATEGRMQDGVFRSSPFVAVGSEREKELLAALRKAAALRRLAFAGRPAPDAPGADLEKELGDYEAAFHPKAPAK